MKIEQLFTGCLAEMAYYIESNGEAAVVDPLRETAPYIQMAEADQAKIKYYILPLHLGRKLFSHLFYGLNRIVQKQNQHENVLEIYILFLPDQLQPFVDKVQSLSKDLLLLLPH